MRALIPDPNAPGTSLGRKTTTDATLASPTPEPPGLHRLGEHLALADAPDPIPGAGQVLIRVLAAGVNRADLLQARGDYPPPSGASPVLGLECSGVVEATGEEVTRWRVGDEVCALVPGGACASLCVAEESLTVPLPLTPLNPAADPRFTPGFSALSDQDVLSSGLNPRLGPHILGATLVEAAATAWMGLVDVGGLSVDRADNAARTVLVHGGTGSVGTIALQLARALGAKVLATAGSPERAVACVSLGAHAALDRHGNLSAFVDAHTHGRGVDVVLDVSGGSGLATNVGVLARHGILVVIGLVGGNHGDLDMARLLSRDLTVRGTTLRARPTWDKARICEALETHVWPLVRRGLVRPVLAGVAPLEDAASLHRAVREGGRIGARVLLP